MSLVAVHDALIGSGKKLPLSKTCNLKGISSNRLAININGLTDVSYGGWVRNLPFFTVAPSWRETGGWGSTYLGTNQSDIECRFGTGSSSSKKQWYYSCPINEWFHVYCVRQNEQMSLYVNGTLVSAQTANSNALRNNGDFSLTNGMYNELNTKIDFSTVGLAFFSRALSENEIIQSKNDVTIDLSKAPYNSGCVMALNCTDGSGNKIKELVSGNYIELTATPIWDIDIPTA